MSQIHRPAALTTEIPLPSSVLLHSRLGVAVAIVAAVALTLGAATEPAWLVSIDESLSEWIRGWGGHDFFRIATNFGSINGALMLSFVAGALLWKRCRPLALALPGVVVAAISVDLTLKVIVDRDRPVDILVGTNLGSFPSGHVIIAVVVLGLLVPALWVATTNRAVFWASVGFLVLGVSLVGVSRVNLGAHWPSDVVASVLIGAAVLLLAEYLLASEWACRRCGGCGLHLPDEASALGRHPDGGTGQEAAQPGGHAGIHQGDVAEDQADG
jgi:undecaprenyl-diphosphatase